MTWRERVWNEMDVLYQDDEPYPEGRESPQEIDLDRVGREDDDDERR